MTKTIDGILQSKLMQRGIPYRLLLPVNYDISQKRYPVLYLLHGLFGCYKNWFELTKLSDYALDKEMIIVLPEAADSWYTDSATVGKDKFESYFIEELIPEIDDLYKTVPKREKRAVVGLSMGGYGALKFGCKRPDLFVFAGSISGAVNAPSRTENNPGVDWENLGSSILKVFGDENNPTRNANDLFQIIGKMPDKEITRLPHFYIDCGTNDAFLEDNRKLAQLLTKRMISFEYYEVSGGHDWEYWDKEIKCILPVVGRKLSLEEK